MPSGGDAPEPAEVAKYLDMLRGACENPQPPPTPTELGEALGAALMSARKMPDVLRRVTRATVDGLTQGTPADVQVRTAREAFACLR